MNAPEIAVLYQFPRGFFPPQVRGYGEIVERHIVQFGLAQKMLNLRAIDMATDVQQSLRNLVAELNGFDFNNQASNLSDTIPYVTKSKEEVYKLRQDVFDTESRLLNVFRDVDTTVRIQLFRLFNFAEYTKDTNVEHLSANGSPVESPEALMAELAIRNIEHIAMFFESIEKSKACQRIFSASDVLQNLEPTVTFGGKTFDPTLVKGFVRLPIIEF